VSGGRNAAVPVDPDKFQHDSRSPQELANAILGHQTVPDRKGRPGTTFGDDLEACVQDMQAERGLLTDAGALREAFLLEALTDLAEGRRLGKAAKRALAHSLQVIEGYRDLAADDRDTCEMEANPDMPRKNEWQRYERKRFGQSPQADEARRAAFDDMESFMVEISNLNAIEGLLRALAHQLGIPLTEPGHRP
jgi:hypothetical protein